MQPLPADANEPAAVPEAGRSAGPSSAPGNVANARKALASEPTPANSRRARRQPAQDCAPAHGPQDDPQQATPPAAPVATAAAPTAHAPASAQAAPASATAIPPAVPAQHAGAAPTVTAVSPVSILDWRWLVYAIRLVFCTLVDKLRGHRTRVMAP